MSGYIAVDMDPITSAKIRHTNIVGVIATKANLKQAQASARDVDFFEWRLDHSDVESVAGDVCKLGKPLIITPRDKSEGGLNSEWTLSDRIRILHKYADVASFIDIEASTALSMIEEINRLHRMGKAVIISYHKFSGSPLIDDIERAHRIAMNVRAEVFKVAVRTDTINDFDVLMDFVIATKHLPHPTYPRIAAMGMGKFGQASRILFGVDGTMFVYGSLGEAVVSGQWHVSELREIFNRK